MCLQSSWNSLRDLTHRLHHIHPVLNLSERTRTQDLLQSVLSVFNHRVSDKGRPSAREGLGTELQRMYNVVLCLRLLPFCEQWPFLEHEGYRLTVKMKAPQGCCVRATNDTRTPSQGGTSDLRRAWRSDQ